jgi:hypothetical protein
MTLRATITSPSGDELDATVRMDIGAVGTVSVAPESDLGILAHSDMSLSLDNSDGEVEAFFEGAAPTDLYEIALERERVDGSGWDRMFGGVLDLRYSLSYNDKTQTAHITAYSYSKQLDRTPANTIERTLASKTASITAGTSTLVFFGTEADDLEVGDVVTLDDGSGVTEDFTVDRLISTSQVKTTEQASNTFASAYTIVATPYYHDKSPTELFGLIAAAADVEFNDLNQGNPLADIPIATPYTQASLNVRGVPISIVPHLATVVSTWPSTYATNRQVSVAPTGAWTNTGGASNVPQLDWTPYLAAEPGTILTSSVADLFEVSPDHAGGFVYNSGVAGGGGTALYRNVSTNLGTWSAVSPSSTDDDVLSTEFEPISGRVFLCQYRKTNPSAQKFRYYDGAFHDIATIGVGGWLRCVRCLNFSYMMMVDVDTNDLHFYDPIGAAAGSVPLHTIEWGHPTDVILHRTARVWGVGSIVGGVQGTRWFSFLFERGGQTWMAIFETPATVDTWTFVGSYRIAASLCNPTGGNLSSRRYKYAYQTILTKSTGEQLAMGYAAGEWFVLATYFAGVIRYADFSDSSCAKAAKDVATVLGGMVNFDQFKVMTVVNRKDIGSGDVVADLPVPIESERRPIAETYRASVQVTGSDRDGNSISEIQGDQGDSASRMTVDSAMISSPGMALACGLSTLQFVSQIRGQWNDSVIDDGTPLAAFNRVRRHDGRECVIYKMDTDLEQQTHELVLLELVP